MTEHGGSETSHASKIIENKSDKDEFLEYLEFLGDSWSSGTVSEARDNIDSQCSHWELELMLYDRDLSPSPTDARLRLLSYINQEKKKWDRLASLFDLFASDHTETISSLRDRLRREVEAKS